MSECLANALEKLVKGGGRDVEKVAELLEQSCSKTEKSSKICN